MTTDLVGPEPRGMDSLSPFAVEWLKEAPRARLLHIAAAAPPASAPGSAEGSLSASPFHGRTRNANSAQQHKPETRPPHVALHTMTRVTRSRSPVTRWSPLSAVLPAGLVANHPQAWLRWFLYIQVPEMLNKCLPLPTRFFLSSDLTITSFTLWPPRGRCTQRNQCGQMSRRERPSREGAGVAVDSAAHFSAHSPTTHADLGRCPRVHGAQCAWGALPVQTPPASHAHCNRCHRAREDADGPSALNHGSPGTARWHAPAGGEALAQKPELVYGKRHTDRL